MENVMRMASVIVKRTLLETNVINVLKDFMDGQNVFVRYLLVSNKISEFMYLTMYSFSM